MLIRWKVRLVLKGMLIVLGWQLKELPGPKLSALQSGLLIRAVASVLLLGLLLPLTMLGVVMCAALLCGVIQLLLWVIGVLPGVCISMMKWAKLERLTWLRILTAILRMLIELVRGAYVTVLSVGLSARLAGVVMTVKSSALLGRLGLSVAVASVRSLLRIMAWLVTLVSIGGSL